MLHRLFHCPSKFTVADRWVELTSRCSKVAIPLSAGYEGTAMGLRKSASARFPPRESPARPESLLKQAQAECPGFLKWCVVETIWFSHGQMGQCSRVGCSQPGWRSMLCQTRPDTYSFAGNGTSLASLIFSRHCADELVGRAGMA